MTRGHLVIESLTVRYSRAVAVDSFSLDLAPGETVAIIGTNGAGKSSLLSALAGIVARDSGRVELDGVALARRSWDVSRTGLSFVPEDRALFSNLTVRDHLRLGVRRLPKAEQRTALDSAHEVFPTLAGLSDRKAGLLSGGERGILAIARAFVARPAVLLLDEPSLGLSPAIVTQMVEGLRRISAGGTTILLSEQTIGVPQALCYRTLVLRRGKVVADGPTAEVVSSATLADVMM